VAKSEVWACVALAGNPGLAEEALFALRTHKPVYLPDAEPIDYQALTAEFGSTGIAGVNNGLDADENERLFTTTLLPEMIALVLRELGRLRKPPVFTS
jgi:hypothetical protein